MSKKQKEREYLLFVNCGNGDRWIWDGCDLQEDCPPLFIPQSCLKDEMSNLKEWMDESEADGGIWDKSVVEVVEFTPERFEYRTSALTKQ
jgi:hypothetical protein